MRYEWERKGKNKERRIGKKQEISENNDNTRTHCNIFLINFETCICFGTFWHRGKKRESEKEQSKRRTNESEGCAQSCPSGEHTALGPYAGLASLGPHWL